MDPKLLIAASSNVVSPFSISSTPLSHLHSTTPAHLSLKSSFWGSNFRHTILGFSSSTIKTRTPFRRFEPVKAAALAKRRKESSFDNVIQNDKKLKLVMKIRKILVSQPDRVMSLKDLGRFRRELGLDKKRRFIALLRKFPAIFDIVEEGVFSLKFRLTPEAERLYLEELQIKNQMEDILVIKLRKLLMMSMDRRILLEKIAHLRADFGLPLEFRDTICQRYPQYFRVTATARGPVLELTHWDQELAVSAAELSMEENQAKEMEEKNLIIDRPVKFNRVRLPKGLNVSKGELRKISLFQDMPFISPYADFAYLKSGTSAKEKHACAVVHEMLSLTLEKRTLVDNLTHFREEFRFSQQIRGMLIRHPDMFYVSLKGDRDSVFLREAYSNSQLIEKDELLLIKEKLRSLVSISPRRGVRKDVADGGEETEGGSGNDEEWTDTVNIMGSGNDEEWTDTVNIMGIGDDDDDSEYDWSDDEEDDGDDDENPPNFDDEDMNISLENRIKQTSKSAASSENKILEPVLPGGRSRERW